MTYVYRDDPEQEAKERNFEQLLEELEEGDCMVVERFSGAAKTSRALVGLLSDLEERGIRFRSLEEGLDTGTMEGRFALGILKKAAQLDGDYRREKQREGINNAKEEGRYKGRKPIEVNDDFFDSILERWRSGEITARQAMSELGLKPNTFYRRVKERMADPKTGETILNAAKQIGSEIAAGVDAAADAAGKFAAECDVDTISSTLDQLGKNITAAGKVLNRHFQEAMEQYEKQNQSQEPPVQFTEDNDEDNQREWI